MGFEPAALSDRPGVLDAEEFVKKMKSIVDHLKTELTASQARYSKNTDSHRSPARRYQPGDLV
ncbi:hypothetical protein OCU04_004427 [Sclerotinia nivalis]|uniref:Uncharacterized protein n=1 Tax=Sclerotinia nivalis TaxID=352851 RepID=A0A9X0AQF0_9HELO|nr:hypothetical protein OCU04_004427 [Sclerotinia nivalis]